MELFFIKPENDFWGKTEFFSELKQSVVNDEDYENSKYLYQTLKMSLYVLVMSRTSFRVNPHSIVA